MSCEVLITLHMIRYNYTDRSTVEPLNNVTFGTSYYVHYSIDNIVRTILSMIIYRGVPFFRGYKYVSTIGNHNPVILPH